MPRRLESEYDAAFHVKLDVKDYREHVNYRNTRRYYETRHTPIYWQNNSSEEDVTLVKDEDQLEQTAIIKKHGDWNSEKRHQTNQASDSSDRSSSIQIDLPACNTSFLKRKRSKSKEKSKNPEHKEIQDLDIERLKKLAVEHAASLTARSEEGELLKHLKRPRNPKMISKPHKASTQDPKGQAPQIKVTPTMDRKRPVFLSYGHADNEPLAGVSVKRTFNVKSATNVYATAVRALQQRQMDLKQQTDKRRKKQEDAIQKLQQSAQHANGSSREYGSSNWQSEYQQRFPQYDNSIYEKVTHHRVEQPNKSMEPLTPCVFMQLVSPRNYMPISKRHHTNDGSVTVR